jgi:ubiquitin-protein ligase
MTSKRSWIEIMEDEWTAFWAIITVVILQFVAMMCSPVRVAKIDTQADAMLSAREATP